MDEFRNSGFHLLDDDAAGSAVSAGGDIALLMSEECLLFDLGEALILTAELATIKLANCAVQYPDLKKIPF